MGSLLGSPLFWLPPPWSPPSCWEAAKPRSQPIAPSLGRFAPGQLSRATSGRVMVSLQNSNGLSEQWRHGGLLLRAGGVEWGVQPGPSAGVLPVVSHGPSQRPLRPFLPTSLRAVKALRAPLGKGPCPLCVAHSIEPRMCHLPPAAPDTFLALLPLLYLGGVRGPVAQTSPPPHPTRCCGRWGGGGSRRTQSWNTDSGQTSQEAVR